MNRQSYSLSTVIKTYHNLFDLTTRCHCKTSNIDSLSKFVPPPKTNVIHWAPMLPTCISNKAVVNSYWKLELGVRISSSTNNIAIEHHTNCPEKFIDPKCLITVYFNGKIVVSIEREGAGGQLPPWQKPCPPPHPQMKLHFVQRSTESCHFESQLAPPSHPLLPPHFEKSGYAPVFYKDAILTPNLNFLRYQISSEIYNK